MFDLLCMCHVYVKLRVQVFSIRMCALFYILYFLVQGHSECSSVMFDRSFVYKQQTSVKTAEMKMT